MSCHPSGKQQKHSGLLLYHFNNLRFWNEMHTARQKIGLPTCLQKMFCWHYIKKHWNRLAVYQAFFLLCTFCPHTVPLPFCHALKATFQLTRCLPATVLWSYFHMVLSYICSAFLWVDIFGMFFPGVLSTLRGLNRPYFCISLFTWVCSTVLYLIWSLKCVG